MSNGCPILVFCIVIALLLLFEFTDIVVVFVLSLPNPVLTIIPFASLSSFATTFEEEIISQGAEPSPSIIASHFRSAERIDILMKNIPYQSLVLYIYRDETEQLMSAIRHLVVSRLCSISISSKLSSTKINDLHNV